MVFNESVVHRSDRGVVVSAGAAHAAANMTTVTTEASTLRIAASSRTPTVGG